MTTGRGSQGRENLRGRGEEPEATEAGNGDCLASTYQDNLF